MPIKSKEAAEQLGISYWRLQSMLRSKKFPPPDKDASGDYVWTAHDLGRARAALSVDYRRKGDRR
jgi:hypothetical protein